MAEGIQIWSRFPTTSPEQNGALFIRTDYPLKGDLFISAPKLLPS